MSITVAGECMVTRPFGVHNEPEFDEVLNRLRSAELTYAHVETNFGHFSEVEAPARGDQVGSYFLTHPQVAADLRAAGVDIVSLANNHSMDFGAKGVHATIAHCDAVGLAHAGTGRDLEEAREPAYLETHQGRVALVSVSSGNKSHEWASHPKASLPGRAGVNPLRPIMRYLVEQEAAEQLKNIGRSLGILRETKAGAEGSSGLLMNAEPGEFSLAMPTDQSTTGSNLWRPSDHFEVLSSSNTWDLSGNLRSVAEAATMADLVIVAHHFSVSEGPRGNTPPRFVQEFAHACIDEGADIFVGHGWHKTLGIEIYRGKPIIYGLGNFFAQSEFVRRVPYDAFETWGHDIERLQTLTPATHPLHPGLNQGNETWWSSAILEIDLDGGTLDSIRLHPVECGRKVGREVDIRRPIGHGEQPLTDGRPFTAHGEDAERILERYQRLSAEFGTTLQIEGESGLIKV
ncbi:CapA family protein [Nocardia sp. CA2R105]|uniref:CapA family protein n=1 Tax=Nocardia coffeae TaxID=2873381 RepID=UPI001CA62D7B|nr:CapA family protein [Nocardia coffeae]MBY8858032.1 CapA family protein [Nocardia coffeae]